MSVSFETAPRRKGSCEPSIVARVVRFVGPSRLVFCNWGTQVSLRARLNDTFKLTGKKEGRAQKSEGEEGEGGGERKGGVVA